MKVPTLDLSGQYQPLREEILDAITRTIDNTAFILGAEVEKLEKATAEYCGTEHAVGVSSGTDALLIALMAAGIGQGDEVILPDFTFFATAGTVARTGATPVFVDIDPRTFNISPTAVEAAVGERTKAIIPVHLYGQVAAMEEILAIADRHGLTVIEDAAQAIGAERAGRRAGAWGDYGAFSFFPSKNLGATGDAGLVTVGDEDMATKLRQLRNHGQTGSYEHELIGGNFRIDALHAAVLNVKLPHLDNWTEARRVNAERYRELFAEAGLAVDPDNVEWPPEGGGRIGQGAVLPREAEGDRHIYNQFVILVDERDGLNRALNEAGIGSRIYYPVPLHAQPCFADLGVGDEDCPVASWASRHVLALPIFGELSGEQIEHVVKMIGDFLKG